MRDPFIAQPDPLFHVIVCELACQLVARGVDACAHGGLAGLARAGQGLAGIRAVDAAAHAGDDSVFDALRIRVGVAVVGAAAVFRLDGDGAGRRLSVGNVGRGEQCQRNDDKCEKFGAFHGAFSGSVSCPASRSALCLRFCARFGLIVSVLLIADYAIYFCQYALVAYPLIFTISLCGFFNFSHSYI